MNIAEAALVLTKCQAFDNRAVTKTNALAFAEALPDVTVEDALAAVAAHFASSDTWLMPSHIATHARSARKARIAAAGPVDYPEGLTPVQEQDWRRCYHRRIGAGTPPAEALLEADRDYAITRTKEIAPMPEAAREAIRIGFQPKATQ